MSTAYRSSGTPPPATNLTPSLQTLLAKQQEHAGLQALREASANLVGKVEELARMGNIMADGGQAIGNVLKNWPQVFSILNLVDTPTSPPASPSQPKPQDDEERTLPTLVRLPYAAEDKAE